jgi:hypothetical protein
MGTLLYFSQIVTLSRHSENISQGHYYLAAGYGTFSYEPKVSYIFGFPSSIRAGGLIFDIPINITAAISNGDTNKKKQFVIQNGVFSSVLEYAIPELMLSSLSDPANPIEGISAIKALTIASAQGQKVLHITRENQATTLQNLRLDTTTMTEIVASINIGMEVITHTDLVSIQGYTGAGYIIFDPVNGQGTYKISGGLNGGLLLLAAYALASLLALIFLVNALFFLAPLAGFVGLVSAPVSLFVSWLVGAATFVTGTAAALSPTSNDLDAYNEGTGTIDMYVTVATLGALGVVFFGLLAPFLAGLFMVSVIAIQLMRLVEEGV